MKPRGKNAHLSWQIQTLESYGEPLKKYLECLHHSHRSLKKEISRLLALGTVYGAKQLADAVDNLLKRGSIGADQVELLLKRREPPVKPPPMNLSDSKLSRIPPRIDLRQYDTLLMETRDDLKQEDPNGNGGESDGSSENPEAN